MEKLVGFEDTQAATYLLRVSYSIVRAVHFMRTTPLRQWKKEGEEFDRMVCDAAGRMLGYPFDVRTFAQAALTPKLGGLGLRKSVEHAGFAYGASWHESRAQSGEVWDRPDQVSATHVKQSVASYGFDVEMHNYLVDSAPNDRERQRLLRVARPHAGSFVTAVPSEEDGRDCLLKPRLFRIAVAYRLGLAVLTSEIPCPLCMQLINVYGDHATCCAKNGDLVIRHNALRNLVYSIASDGLLKPVLEKQGILGPTTGRRPGDVAIPDWKHHNGLAIDVAVTSPLAKRNLRLVSPCEDYAATEKHKKYDTSFEGTSYYFCAMVFETLGGINDQGEEVLRQLFTFAAQHLGREFSSFCSRGWARVSCCLQRSVAQVIANRIDGRQEVAEPEAESLVTVVGEEQGNEEHEGGESLGGELLIGKPAIGIMEPLISKPSVGKSRGIPSQTLSFPSQIPSQPSSFPSPIPPHIPPFPSKAPSPSELLQVSKSGVGGEVVDLGDGGRDGEEGQTIHSENTTHIDSNRLRGQKQGSGDTQQAAHGSAKGEKQGRTRRDGSAKNSGMGDSKDSHGEISNKVPYSNSLDGGSGLFSHNTNTGTTSITIQPTYNKHNAGSSTSTSSMCRSVEPSKPRRGVHSISDKKKEKEKEEKDAKKENKEIIVKKKRNEKKNKR